MDRLEAAVKLTELALAKVATRSLSEAGDREVFLKQVGENLGNLFNGLYKAVVEAEKMRSTPP